MINWSKSEPSTKLSISSLHCHVIAEFFPFRSISRVWKLPLFCFPNFLQHLYTRTSIIRSQMNRVLNFYYFSSKLNYDNNSILIRIFFLPSWSEQKRFCRRRFRRCCLGWDWKNEKNFFLKAHRHLERRKKVRDRNYFRVAALVLIDSISQPEMLYHSIEKWIYRILNKYSHFPSASSSSSTSLILSLF